MSENPDRVNFTVDPGWNPVPVRVITTGHPLFAEVGALTESVGDAPVTVNPLTGQPYAAPFDANTDITGQINKINLGLTGGAGFTQRLIFGELVLDVRGAYGLSTIQHNPDNGDNHIGNLLVSLGYSIPL